MQVQIKETTPFSVGGVASRHQLPGVKTSADIPAYWNIITMDYGKHLTRLYDAFAPAKHGEFGLCFDVDEVGGTFTYMLGVTFDSNADAAKTEPDMQKIEISGGLYAVFTTPKAPSEEYPQAIAIAWTEILTDWLPKSGYMFDESRLSYEAYDERDHGDTVQMEIRVPICKRK